MLRYRPYEHRIVRLHFQAASVLERLVLQFTLESLVPALQVLQAETFHVKFLHALLFDNFQPIVRIYRNRTSCLIARSAQRRKVVACFRVVSLFRIGFSTEQILLCQTEHLGHAQTVDII